MGEEDKKEEGLSFKTVDELTSFLLDLQGQLVNMQETVDKLSPVEDDKTDDVENVPTDDVTEEELTEIDRLLQSE